MENNNNTNNLSAQELTKPKFQFSLGAVVKGAFSTVFDNLGASIVASLLFIGVAIIFFVISLGTGLLFTTAPGDDKGVLKVDDTLLLSTDWTDSINNFVNQVEQEGVVAVTNTTKQSVESLRVFVDNISTQVIENGGELRWSDISTENLNRDEILDALTALNTFIKSADKNGVDTDSAQIALNNLSAYYNETFVHISWTFVPLLIAIMIGMFLIALLPIAFISHFGLVALSSGSASMRDLFPSFRKTMKFIGATMLYQIMLIVLPVALFTFIALTASIDDLYIWVALVMIIITPIVLYIAIRYAFVGYSILERNTSIVESFKDSSALVKGAYLKLIAITIVVMVLTVISMFVTLGIGFLFFVYPFQYFAYVYTYKALQQRATERTVT